MAETKRSFKEKNSTFTYIILFSPDPTLVVTVSWLIDNEKMMNGWIIRVNTYFNLINMNFLINRNFKL